MLNNKYISYHTTNHRSISKRRQANKAENLCSLCWAQPNQVINRCLKIIGSSVGLVLFGPIGRWRLCALRPHSFWTPRGHHVWCVCCEQEYMKNVHLETTRKERFYIKNRKTHAHTFSQILYQQIAKMMCCK